MVTLNIVYGIDLDVDTTQLYNLSDFISRVTGIKIHPNKPIVGENAFIHESEIYVHGVLENTATYELIDPELIRHRRKITFGKHTGPNALKAKIYEYDIKMNDDQFCSLYDQVKRLGDKGKSITDADLKAIALTILEKTKKEAIKLVGLSVNSGFGKTISPTATVKLKINEKEKEISSIGVSPVDAELNAIQKLMKEIVNIELEEYHIESVAGGTDVLAEVFVIISDENGNRSTGIATREDIIMASVDAVLNSMNKILLIKDTK